jgi:tRNA(Ile2) C34 agmatinyltransferase TiaS
MRNRQLRCPTLAPARETQTTAGATMLHSPSPAFELLRKESDLFRRVLSYVRETKGTEFIEAGPFTAAERKEIVQIARATSAPHCDKCNKRIDGTIEAGRGIGLCKACGQELESIIDQSIADWLKAPMGR